jgi:aconitate hydratase
MGVVPFVFEEGTSWKSLDLEGDEMVTIEGLADVKPRQKVVAKVTRSDGSTFDLPLVCRVDTADEIDYLKNGGILQTVLRDLAA